MNVAADRVNAEGGLGAVLVRWWACAAGRRAVVVEVEGVEVVAKEPSVERACAGRAGAGWISMKVAWPVRRGRGEVSY